MNKHLGTEAVLRALEELRDALREFARREAALKADFDQRVAQEKTRHEHALGNAQTRAAEEQEQTAAELQAAEARVETWRAARAARLKDARRRARKTALDRVEAEEGQIKFTLQREMLRATRERESALAEADARLAEFQSASAARQERLTALERRAVDLLGVYGRRMIAPLERAHETAHADLSGDEHALAERFETALRHADDELRAFSSAPLSRLSRWWPLWLVLVLSPVLVVPVLQFLGIQGFSYASAGVVALALAIAGPLTRFVGRRGAQPAARRITESVGQARVYLHASQEAALATRRAIGERVESAHNEAATRANHQWNHAVETAERKRQDLPADVDARAQRAEARLRTFAEARLSKVREAHAQTVEARRRAAEARIEELGREHSARTERLRAEREAAWSALVASWKSAVTPPLEALRSVQEQPGATAPDLSELMSKSWTPPSSFIEEARVGRFTASLAKLAGEMPADPRLALPEPLDWDLPILLVYPEAGSLLLETRAHPAARDKAIATLNQVVFRLLATAPPGRCAFTILDPVGQGRSFAGLTHLSDEADHLISGRIWTQTQAIEQRLGELNDHVERIIQMCLRNEYADIAEYNRVAGNIAEKYRFLVVADFPANFSDIALRRLRNLLANGPRCGVCTLIHWDAQAASTGDIPAAELRRAGVTLTFRDEGGISVNGRLFPGMLTRLDPAPPADRATEFLQTLSRVSADAHRVEVPFEQVAPDPQSIWSLDTADEIRVPIGRTAATKFQHLAIGKGTRQHALIAGKTGSGKSTLLHVIITNLALWCDPDQVEFYLVDFKKGVEFKGYATHRLPHARVVAIASDREFGLSVLERLDEELRRRGELFRRAGVQDLPGYRRTASPEPTPRVLLLVDEFQEFFVEEDHVAQGASVLLDRIVRQGRAFGIHVILGSQTLGGAYTVARSTLGQMVIRVALQCNEADAYLIMEEDNPAPRLLSRPGEAIYNDAAGAKDANSTFQIVWLPDHERDRLLRAVRERADQSGRSYPSPMVFEGNAPADPRENPRLAELLARARSEGMPATPPAEPRVWLGAPNSIKGPTETRFPKQSGANLLMVGQNDDALVALAVVAGVALAAQGIPGADLVVIDSTAAESANRRLLEALAAAVPGLRLIRAPQIPDVMSELAAELRRRQETVDDPASSQTAPRFVFILGIQHFRALRQEDEFSFSSEAPAEQPAAQLKELLSEGPRQGIHLWIACDNYNNVSRFLGRKGLSEFGSRVLFQMGANDSASLIDHPGASRLGLHRALLHLEGEARFEIFRPYAAPDPAWLAEAQSALTSAARPDATGGLV